MYCPVFHAPHCSTRLIRRKDYGKVGWEIGRKEGRKGERKERRKEGRKEERKEFSLSEINVFFKSNKRSVKC